MRAFLAAILALSIAHPALAAPLDPAAQSALSEDIGGYFRAIEEGDAKGIIATLPPRIIGMFANAAGASVADIEGALVSQTATLIQGISFTDLAADESALDATTSTLDDGTSVTWVLVPTSFVSEAEGKKTRQDQPLLALQEDGTWHFVRIDGPQQQEMVSAAYPFLAGASFPQSSSTPIE